MVVRLHIHIYKNIEHYITRKDPGKIAVRRHSLKRARIAHHSEKHTLADFEMTFFRCLLIKIAINKFSTLTSSSHFFPSIIDK